MYFLLYSWFKTVDIHNLTSENTEIVCKQENDKIPCDGKDMMDRAGAPNDCLGAFL